MPARGLRALVFDVDGVLAETERDGHLPAFNEAFREAGFDWDWDPELYRRLQRVRGSEQRLRHFIRYWRPCGVPRSGNEALVEALVRGERRHYLQRLASGAVPLREGVARLLREAAAAGVDVAVATTGTRDAVEALLAAGLGPDGPGLLRAVAAADPVTDGAVLYGGLLAQLEVGAGQAVAFASAPERCAAAAAAGLDVVVVPSEYTPRRRFPGARLVVSTLGGGERPFRVIAGDAGGERAVTVPALRAWHAAWAG